MSKYEGRNNTLRKKLLLDLLDLEWRLFSEAALGFYDAAGSVRLLLLGSHIREAGLITKRRIPEIMHYYLPPTAPLLILTHISVTAAPNRESVALPSALLADGCAASTVLNGAQ